jgi:hypothetical protein
MRQPGPNPHFQLNRIVVVRVHQHPAEIPGLVRDELEDVPLTHLPLIKTLGEILEGAKAEIFVVARFKQLCEGQL